MNENNYTPQVAEEEVENGIPPEEFFDEFYRPRLSFGQKLIIYITVWVALIFAACGVMWSIMQQYEEAQPWYAVEDYLTTSGQSAFFLALNKAYGGSANKYESLYEVASDLSAKYTGRVTYKKLVREYTYENPVYLLCSGDENLLKLTLQRGEKTGFMGLLGYEVRTVELVNTDILSFSDYALVYPKGASVKVNGKEFSPEATDRYTVFGSDEYTVCMLENLLDRPTVKVTFDGTVLVAEEGENFIFDYPEKKLRTVSITAPNGAYVFLNGRRVPDGFVSDTFESAPDRFGNTVSLTAYNIPTVVGECTVSSSQEGNQLLATVDGDVYTFASSTLECTVIAPSEATLYANGEALEKSEKTAVWRTDFEDVANAPYASEYVYTDIYAVPEFTAKIGETELVKAEDEERTVFLSPASEELKEKYTEKTLDFMNAYLYYTTQGYSNTRANLNAVKAHVAAPSPLYTNLERSYIGYYYIAPQQMTVDYMEVDNFVPYGDDAFTCELSYKLTLKNWVGEAVDENTMRIAFARRGNTFLPVNMLLAGK